MIFALEYSPFIFSYEIIHISKLQRDIGNHELQNQTMVYCTITSGILGVFDRGNSLGYLTR